MAAEAAAPGLFAANARLAHRPTSRAVSRSRSSGVHAVLEVRLDGLDHQVQFVGAVDLPADAVVLAWREHVGFSEVMQPVNAARRVVSQQEDR
jgi:hypothetical protein